MKLCSKDFFKLLIGVGFAVGFSEVLEVGNVIIDALVLLAAYLVAFTLFLEPKEPQAKKYKNK